MRYGWSIALFASVAAVPVSAQNAAYPVDIDARNLPAALAQLAAQTGISWAVDDALPRRPVRRVRGRMTVDEALVQLLDPIGWEAVRVAPRAYRLRARPPRILPDAPEPPPPDIIVTARKRDENASAIPGPVAVYIPGPDRGGVTGANSTTRDVARSVGGLSVTDAGPGAERLSLRGVADSPFNGFSQSTVSVQLDETRIAFDGADPGLRLVDVARVELLKGPQGPLYGTGALGGVYRIVTNRPLLDRVDAEAGGGLSKVSGGGGGPHGHAMINMPLFRNLLAVRVVGYGAVDPGWIDDEDGPRDTNRIWTRGARVAARLAPSEDWLIDAGGTWQGIDARDTHYVDRPGSYRRTISTREGYAGRFSAYQGTVTGPIDHMRLTIAMGLTTQNQAQRYDGGSTDLGVPITFFTGRRLRVFDQEIRLASAPDRMIRWVTGASILVTRTEGHLAGLASRDNVLRQGGADRDVREVALFADGSAPLADRWRLGIGARLFRTGTRNNGVGIDRDVGSARILVGVTPNISLSYTPAADRIVYARFATAYRPGGLNLENRVTRRYDADQVRTLDLGGRVRLFDGRLGLDGNIFLTRWTDIQSDYLLPLGWIATRNAGRASIPGTEWSIDWRPGNAWRVEAGAIVQRPRRDGMATSPYLPLVPDVSGRWAVSREMGMGAWHVTPRLSAEVTGTTRLGPDEPLERRMPPRVIERFSLVGRSGRLTMTLDIDNLTGTRTDMFAMGNPFLAQTGRYYTPHRPRTLSIVVTRRLSK